MNLEHLTSKRPPALKWWILALVCGLGIIGLSEFGLSQLPPLDIEATPAPAQPAAAQPAAAPDVSDAEAATPFLEYDAEAIPFLEDNAARVDQPFWETALDTGLKLAVVLGLLFLSLKGLRWLQKKGFQQTDGSPTIQVLETVGLAPGRNLHLIVAGDKTLLVGSTESQVSFLTEVSSAPVPLPDTEVETENNEDRADVTITTADTPAIPSRRPEAMEAPFAATLAQREAETMVSLSQAATEAHSKASPAEEDSQPQWQHTLTHLRAGIQHMQKLAEE